MEYNTTREKMAIPEYGRNVQKMIDYALTIEDKEKRTDTAKLIVAIMGQLNPAQKESGDFKRKLWDHLIIISDYKLDVDSPFPAPEKEHIEKKPEQIPYQQSDFPFRSYGKNIGKMLKEAANNEEGNEKKALVLAIANHMKKLYISWNRENVSDEIILQNLKILSEGKLELEEGTVLEDASIMLPPQTQKKKWKKKGGSSSGKGNRKKR